MSFDFKKFGQKYVWIIIAIAIAVVVTIVLLVGKPSNSYNVTLTPSLVTITSVDSSNEVINLNQYKLFAKPGEYTWETPEGVTEVYFTLIGGSGGAGGGGGGSAGTKSLDNGFGDTHGCGGASGANGGNGGIGQIIIREKIIVDKNRTFKIVVGEGGKGGDGGSGGTTVEQANYIQYYGTSGKDGSDGSYTLISQNNLHLLKAYPGKGGKGGSYGAAYQQGEFYLYVFPKQGAQGGEGFIGGNGGNGGNFGLLSSSTILNTLVEKSLGGIAGNSIGGEKTNSGANGNVKPTTIGFTGGVATENKLQDEIIVPVKFIPNLTFSKGGKGGNGGNGGIELREVTNGTNGYDGNNGEDGHSGYVLIEYFKK